MVWKWYCFALLLLVKFEEYLTCCEKEEGYNGWEDQEEGVNSYWMTVRKEYCRLIEEAPDRALWRTRFGRSYGRFVRPTTNGVVRSLRSWGFCNKSRYEWDFSV